MYIHMMARKDNAVACLAGMTASIGHCSNVEYLQSVKNENGQILRRKTSVPPARAPFRLGTPTSDIDRGLSSDKSVSGLKIGARFDSDSTFSEVPIRDQE